MNLAADAARLANAEWAVEVLRRAGADPTRGLCTVFAPTNHAIQMYAATDSGATDALRTAAGTDVVNAHVISGAMLSTADMEEGETPYATDAGTEIVISKRDDVISVASGGFSANIVTPNITHGNAKVHLIDSVLAPVRPTVTPTAAPAAVPAATPAATPAAMPTAPPAVGPAVGGMAGAATAPMADLSWATESLVRAGAAGLLQTVSTVFVPSNAAIDRYGGGAPGATITALEGPAGLAAISGHVLPGVSMAAADFPAGTTSTYMSAAGTPVTVDMTGPTMRVTCGSLAANVLAADIPYGTSIVHVVDSVLAPLGGPAAAVPPPATVAGGAPRPAGVAPTVAGVTPAVAGMYPTAADMAAAAAPAGPGVDVTTAKVTTGWEADLSWATEAARLAGMDADLLARVSTIFVPSNDALAAYAAANPAAASSLGAGAGASTVSSYVVPNMALTSADIPAGATTLATLTGIPLVVANNAGALAVATGNQVARIIRSDLTAGAAIIHIIDNVLATPAV